MNRRGAESIAGSLIMFIAVMSLATTTTVLFKNHLDESQSATIAQQKETVSVIRTNFVISLASYNDADTTYIYVKNTGSTKFDEEDVDLYIDGFRIPRSYLNRSINVTSDTDTINADVWDPGEELEIQYFHTFGAAQTHTVKIVAPNGVAAEEEFSS